jgi:hypothetical protein
VTSAGCGLAMSAAPYGIARGWFPSVLRGGKVTGTAGSRDVSGRCFPWLGSGRIML